MLGSFNSLPNGKDHDPVIRRFLDTPTNIANIGTPENSGYPSDPKSFSVNMYETQSGEKPYGIEHGRFTVYFRNGE